MRLLVLAIAALMFLPFSASASHDSDCAQVSSVGPDGDRDRDGMPDAWEREHFGNMCQDAGDDFDHDGNSNGAEYKAGTDPADAADPPERDDEDEAPKNDTRDESEARPSNSGRGNNNSLAAECGDSDDRRACVAEYCKDHRDDRRCKAAIKEACERHDCAALSSACAKDDAKHMRACDALARIDEARLHSKHIDFDLNREGRELLNYTVGDTLVFSSIAYGDAEEEFKFRQDGARIRFQSDDARLELHDSATGQFWFRSDEGRLVLTLPDGVMTMPTSNGHILDYGTRSARIAGDYEFDGVMIIANESFKFFSPTKNGVQGAAVDEAKAAGKLGAEATVSASGSNVTAYDDVEVNISAPAAISAESPLRVLVSAELEEGRTVIIDVDPALLTGPDLELRYFDVLDDGNETEVVFRMASSLADVLDPSDDGGQPEYWIVEDEDGLHIMASIPHWSTHAIELASVGEFLVQPSVLIGVAAGILGVGGASAAMFWPRRQDPY